MKNGWFDEKNRVYIIYQISEIQENLGVSKKKAIDYLTEREQFGLVEKTRPGFAKHTVYQKFYVSAGCYDGFRGYYDRNRQKCRK